MTVNLTAFLNARLESDWAWAETVLDEPNMAELHGIARRWLREVEAKRRILAFSVVLDEDRYAGGQGGHYLRCALAAVYSDHPGYDPAWA